MTVLQQAAAARAPIRNAAEERVWSARRRDLILRIALGIGFPAAILIIWQTLTIMGVIDQRFFPSPSRIVTTAISVLTDPAEAAQVLAHIEATMGRVLIGYCAGAVLGVIVGSSMGHYRVARYAFGPTIYATFPTPKLAIFPLLIIIFGLGDPSKISLITLGVFFMTCINTMAGVLYANPIYGDLAQAYRIPLATRWFKIILPSALPSIFAGLKLGIGQALILVVAAEFVSSNDGIGYYIWNSWQVLDIPRMFVGLMIVSLIGGAAVLVCNFAERWLIPWSKAR